jgi:biotin carboxyl carrier protein
MTFEVDIAGRSRSVAIERVGGRRDVYRITVDGQAYVVSAVRVGEFGVSVLGTVLFSGQPPEEKRTAGPSADIFVSPGGAAGELLVTYDGRTVAASLNGRRRHAREAGDHAHGEQRVTAPMPGRVVRVLVSPGDEVAARQGIVVVEAMKMENELRSPKAGRVKDVSVTPGTSVEAGRVLVVIE